MLKSRLTWFGILCLVGLFAVSTIIISGCVKSVPTQEEKSTAAETKTEVASNDVAGVNKSEGVYTGAKLQSTDCQKCHDTQAREINSDGKRHKTAITCQDCHVEHPPWGDNTIPQCSNCHEGREHFNLPDCLACHSNPHTPLDLTISDTPESTVGCKTCHSDKGEEFKKFPSKHSEQNCTLCHPLKHKVIHNCFTCHEPHAKTMKYEDCLRCHKPHSPLNITYADDTPSELCGACHQELYKSLTSNPSKHRELNCATCHQNKHPTVPECTDCHEGIHDKSLLDKFPDCLKCHADPHNLVI